MKDNKGFTLIEIIAVILVLGIVTSIGIFSMGKIKEDYEKETYLESVKNVLTSAENYYLSNIETPFPSEGILVSDSRIELTKKDIHTSGNIMYDETLGKLKVVNITNGKFCVNGVIDNLVIIKGNCT